MFELEQRGAVSPLCPRKLPGTFAAHYELGDFEEVTEHGTDHGAVFFGYYSEGKECRPALLIRRYWEPAPGFAAEGAEDTLVVLYHQGALVR